MRVVCDAGGCCGIKIIRDFSWYGPDDSTMMDMSVGHCEDQCTSSPRTESWHKSPRDYADCKGTGRDIFKRLLNHIFERRPAGMVQVNLATTQMGWSKLDAWDDLFTELGFERTHFVNSNSGATIRHYSLVYDKGYDGDECYDEEMHDVEYA